MGYPTDRVLVYDRSGDFACELALDEVFARVRVEQINDEHELAITTTRPLAEGMRVITCDATGKRREYVIYRPDRAHERGEHALGTYVAMWSLQYDLMTSYADEHAEPGMGGPCTGSTAVAAALDGQARWQVGTVDVASVAAGKGCVMIGISAWERLKLVVKHWHGEVDAEIAVDGTRVTSRRVALRAHLGTESATRRFDWGEDLAAIRRTPDPGPYYCRIIPLGRGQREWAEDDETEFDWPTDISEETGGVTYVEDPEAAQAFRTGNPDGTWHYPTKVVRYDEDDPELLLARATEDLHNHTRPGVGYEADVLQFAEAGMDVSGVELGDNTQCADRGFDADAPLAIEGRVLRMEVNELSPATDTKLTIGCLAPSLAKTLTSLVGESTRSVTQRVESIERGGTIAYLENLVDQLNEIINATGGYTYLIPGEGSVTYDSAVSDPLVGAEATRITQVKGGTIRIATTKKPGFAGINDWNYKMVFDGDHVAANMVTAAQIVTGFIGRPDGAVYIDLDNEVINFGGGATFGGTPVTSIVSDASAARSDASSAVATANGAAQKVDDTPIVTLSSTNGTVFKRNLGVTTTIIATVFTPGGLISTAAELRRRFGAGAYLQWGWRDVVTDADHWLIITDPRITRDGFALTVSPEDIDTQAVITCRLIA